MVECFDCGSSKVVGFVDYTVNPSAPHIFAVRATKFLCKDCMKRLE